MQLDHVFVFVEPGAQRAQTLMEAAGFVETYRRVHPGQGTANICYALDNAFIELLWLTNEDEANGPLIKRMGLAQRASWGALGTSPFGIAWRLDAGVKAQPVPTWSYTPPYLPAGMSIQVATLSDDPRQPMCFASPGTQPPSQWPPERQGQLQRPSGLSVIRGVELGLPAGSSAPEELRQLTRAGLLSLSPQPTTRLDLKITCADGALRTFRLPELRWCGLAHE